jgi:O-antigen/teichoic acid export membrane protein
MSRARRILGATWVGYVQQAATLVVGLWLTPFLLRNLGQHDLGLWLVVTQVLGYLALVDLGILAILPREVALASSRPESRPGITRLVAQVRTIVHWQVAALAVISIGLLLALPAQWVGLRWPLAGVLAVFVGAYPLRIPSAVLQGLQDLPYLAKTQMLGWAVGTATTILLVWQGWRLSGLIAGWSVTLLLPAVLAAWRLRRTFTPASDAGTGTVPGYFGRSVWVSAGQLGQVFLNGSDVLLIGNLLGAATVVPYSVTAKLVTIFTNYPQMLVHSAQPALTELRGAGAKDRLVDVTGALMRGMLILSGVLGIVVIATNRFFVSWWVGHGLYGGGALTAALAAMMLVRHWNVATNYTLFCFGYERQLSLIALGDGVVTLAAMALLVPRLGLLGAPIASMIGALAVGLPANVRASAREMGVSVWTFVRPCLTILSVIALVDAVGVAGHLWLDTTRPLVTVAFTTGMVALYAAAVAPFVLADPLRPYAQTALSMFIVRQPRREAAAA